MKTAYIMRETYRHMRGFEYLSYSVFSLCLILVLGFLPLAPLFANVDASETVSIESEIIAETEEELSQDTEESEENTTEEASSEVEEANSSEDILEPEIPVNESEEVVEDADVASGTPSDTNAVLLDENESNTEDAGNTHASTTDSVIATSTEKSTSTISENQNSEDEKEDDHEATDDVTSDSPDTLDDDADSVINDTEEDDNGNSAESDTEIAGDESLDDNELVDATENSVTVANTHNDGSTIAFDKTQCVSVGNEAYYCSQSTDEAESVGVDRVFAAIDNDGDREIYIEHSGSIIQVTENTVDDDGPYYDALSENIVWHRLVNGRYQIVQYSIDDDTEVIITDATYNNMEPNAYRGDVVWQAWIGSGWEIMYYGDDGVTQLTFNDTHDIAPSINEDYIVWQSFNNGVWQVQVYDRGTGEIEHIGDTEGASVENARFVLVYDARYDNGDIETRGYDLKTRESMPLTATPVSVPEKIPEPEQTGEERAFVQQNIQLKQKSEKLDDVPDADHNKSVSESVIASSTNDVVVPPFVSEETSSASSTIEVPPSLLVPQEPADAEDSTAHIEDVVVPPHVEEAPDTVSEVVE